jgi:hypothetical protein
MQPFCLLLACWEGGPSLKSKSKSTFDDLLRWSMSVIVVSSGLMQLIWKSMGDIMFHRKYNWEVRNTVIPSKLYLWPLCPGPVRVQGIVFLQLSAPSAYQRKLLMVLLGLPGGWGCVINRHILPVGLVKPEILLCQKDQISQRICEDRRQTNKICSTVNLSVYYFVNFVILCELLKTCQYTMFFLLCYFI